MTSEATSSEVDRLTEKIAAGIDQARPASDGTESNSSLGETVNELFDVLKSTDALLETIDLDRLPDVVDEAELPGLVDLDHLSDAINERDPDLLFDLSELKRVVDTRALELGGPPRIR